MESTSRGESTNISKQEKTCDDCKTSRTPLWRSGPAGPKSLCNACGIRYRKKKSHSGVTHSNNEKQPTSPSTTSSSSTMAASSINRGDDYGVVMRSKDLKKKLRIKLVALGKEVVLLQRQRSPLKKVKRRKLEIENEYKKLGEVEQAAFLLMSLSCGSG